MPNTQNSETTVVVTETPNEATTTPAPKKTKKAPQKRTPAPKPRTLEELDDLDPKKMTPAESVLYIEALRDYISMQSAKINELTKNAASAYDQYKNADAAYRDIKNRYDADIALVKQIINTAAKTINLVGAAPVI